MVGRLCAVCVPEGCTSWKRLAFVGASYLISSVASLAIFPLQDVLGLGIESCMNLPGTLAGNWEWRARPEALTLNIAARLANLSTVYERHNSPAFDGRLRAVLQKRKIMTL